MVHNKRHLKGHVAPEIRAYLSQPNDWSKPIPIGRLNEVMAILTKRVAIKL
ncbi:MAG: hypothetical protein AAF572_25615 [Cyanobacteria bacterium P01_B01_bin.77]